MSATSILKAFSKLDLLRLMATSREGDRREGILLRQGKGWFQVSGAGHEGIGAMAYALRPDDVLFPYYRDRALVMARGMTNYELALAYFAKRESNSGGRQMPAHFSHRPHNIFSVCTPTGGTLLPAVGFAWAMKLDKKDTVVLANMGDAASRQGEFYEALAFAVQENLPAIFVVEDNKYGISTPTEHLLPFRLGVISEHLVQKLDARDTDAVYAMTSDAVAKARAGGGPTLIWADVDRLGSHTSSDDHRVYRPIKDIEDMQKRDPIKLLSDELIETGALTAEDWEAMQADIARVVDEEYAKAEKAADPKPTEVSDFNLSETDRLEHPPIHTGKQNMVQAINRTLHKAAEADPNVIFFGEDIEDPKGGVFGLTKGLTDSYPSQVFNSPLAEATIVGVAVGMAAYGRRPVFELQFIDFIGPAWNQLVTNVSTLRWRTAGAWTCPLVLYAAYGAYLPGGSLWHSQSNEGGLAHVTGLRIAVPSTPEDAAGLFWTAIHGDDPTIILVPKHIFRKNADVKKVEALPFGKARIVREGSDVTVVAWGNCVEIAEAAAEQLADEASVEIVDLRSIVPTDYATIVESVSKTGRLVVIHEDTHTCGFGQAIVAEMTRIPERWNLFLAAPQLVAREDVPIGYHPIYEYAALPDVPRLIGAIRKAME